MPMVSSGIPVPPLSVPHTVTPCSAAAATSIDEFVAPVVTSSSSAGKRASVLAGNGVRSRITTITVEPASAATSSSASAMCSVRTSISKRAATSDQSAQVSAADW